MRIKGKFSCASILLTIFIIFNSLPGYAGDVRGVTDKAIKIGTVGDLTGPIATTWFPVANAIKDYYRYVNETGGVNGRMIKNIFEDDRYTIPLALSSFKKLVFRDRVLMLMAASGVGHTHSIIPLAEKNKVPLMAQTNDYRYFYPARRYVFTGIPFYEDQIALIFEYIHKDLQAENPSIALAYPDSASGNISRDTCRKLSKEYNVKDYTEIIISVGAGDFTSQIMTLKRLKPEYVIIHGYVGSTSAFMRDVYKFKLKSKFIVIQYGCVDDVIKLAGASSGGLIGTNSFSSWNDESPGIKGIRKIVKTFHPETTWKTRNFAQGWFIAFLIHHALENAGRDLNIEAVVEGFEGIRNFDTQGLCGVVSYGPDDHKAIDYSRFYKVDLDKKQFVPITDWRKPTAKNSR